jgi:hypothetical protein
LEFAYLKDFWTVSGADAWGHPKKDRRKVEADIEKISRYLVTEACTEGYVIVFEECDSGFPRSFVADVEASSKCRVRFVRGY